MLGLSRPIDAGDRSLQKGKGAGGLRTGHPSATFADTGQSRTAGSRFTLSALWARTSAVRAYDGGAAKRKLPKRKEMKSGPTGDFPVDRIEFPTDAEAPAAKPRSNLAGCVLFRSMTGQV